MYPKKIFGYEVICEDQEELDKTFDTYEECVDYIEDTGAGLYHRFQIYAYLGNGSYQRKGKGEVS